MTQNQIAYQRHLEDMRHNRASEEVEARKTRASEIQADAAADQAFSARKNAEANLITAKSNQAKNVFSNIKSVFDMFKGVADTVSTGVDAAASIGNLAAAMA